MLTNHKQIDKRTTMKNQNRSAALGRSAMKLLGGFSHGGLLNSSHYFIMDKKSIIHWNCRGLKANYNEVLILMSLFSPSVICLQETFLKQSDNVSFRDFNMFNYIYPDGQRASGGTSIMVKSSVPHSQFDLNTNL